MQHPRTLPETHLPPSHQSFGGCSLLLRRDAPEKNERMRRHVRRSRMQGPVRVWRGARSLSRDAIKSECNISFYAKAYNGKTTQSPDLGKTDVEISCACSFGYAEG